MPFTMNVSKNGTQGFARAGMLLVASPKRSPAN
jgi:hypothetical protein